MKWQGWVGEFETQINSFLCDADCTTGEVQTGLRQIKEYIDECLHMDEYEKVLRDIAMEDQQ